MNLHKIVEELSEIEKTVLLLLTEEKHSLHEIEAKTDLNKDSIMRAIAWLNQKELAEVFEEKIKVIELTLEGKKAFNEGLIEKKFIQKIKDLNGKTVLSKLKESNEFGNELNFVLGHAKKNAWVSILKKGNDLEVELTGLEKDLLQGNYKEEKLIHRIGKEKPLEKKLTEEELQTFKELNKRGLVIEEEKIHRKIRISNEGKKARELFQFAKNEINTLSRKELISQEWKNKGFRKYNIQDPVPEIWAGKRQPYIQFLSQIRRKLVELGFKEMFAPTIVSEFYNFDVLFQPQNHPARTWTDTYQLKQPQFGKLPDRKIVQAVRAAHETGGVSASSGWGYQWSEEIASKLMPSAHATAHSARQIVQGIKIPGKYFAIARCYRPDVIDATHLVEFNQMDGFIAGEELNFRHLLGILKQFAVEVAGAEKVRFYPDYYPFTEPSVQLSAKHPELGWIEFAGAGIFRPEMTENQGIKCPVIAWGIGIDRLAMFKLGIRDIRHLFSEDLNYLRNAKMVD